MDKAKELSAQNSEVRELTSKDMRSFKPAKDILPASLLKKIGDLKSPKPQQ
jgi:hypothetical protein